MKSANEVNRLPNPAAGAAAAKPAKFLTQQRIRRWGPVFAVAAILLLVGTLWAVRKARVPPRSTPFSRDVMNLLNQKAVQKELALSDEQMTKIREFGADRRMSMEDFRDLSPEVREARMNEQAQAAEKTAVTLLDSSQFARLKQIYYQRRGSAAWTEKEVVAALKLTKDQRRAAILAEDDLYEQMRAIPPDTKREERQKKTEALRKSADEQWLNILTEEQREQWKDMLGTPFKSDQPPPGMGPFFRPGGFGPGGGGRGAGGRGGRGNRTRQQA
jgi:hypothetical protein